MSGERQNWKRKRKTIVVDKEFQFRYLMTWVLLTTSLLAGLVLASLSVFIFFNGDRTYFVWINAGCAGVITALSMYYIVLHSHRIAGPAFRLKRVLSDIADGRRGFRVKLRHKDYLKEVADAINVLLEKIEEKEAKVNELGRLVGELSKNGHDVGKVHDVANRVSRELEELCPPVKVVMLDGEEKKQG